MNFASNGRRAAWTTFAALVGTTLGLNLGASPSLAAPMTPYTASNGKQKALVLDQTGRRIAVPRAGAELPEGTTPTYLAYRLTRRDPIPEGAATVAMARPGRNAVGPLRLDALAIQSLNARLAESGQVVLQEPRQAYLVERAGGDRLADDATRYWRAATSQAKSDADALGDTVKGWYNDGADAVKKLNNQITDALKKTFNPPAPKVVIINPVTQAAAQVLDAPEPTSTPVAAQLAAETAQPAPVPEPAAWIVFAAAALLGVHRHRRPRKADAGR